MSKFLIGKIIILLLRKKEIFENENEKKEKKKKEKILKNIEEMNSMDTENYFEREKINLMKNYLVLKRRKKFFWKN